MHLNWITIPVVLSCLKEITKVSEIHFNPDLSFQGNTHVCFYLPVLKVIEPLTTIQRPSGCVSFPHCTSSGPKMLFWFAFFLNCAHLSTPIIIQSPKSKMLESRVCLYGFILGAPVSQKTCSQVSWRHWIVFVVILIRR